MARYFFHLHNHEELIDEEGTELPDMAAALVHGRRQALGMAVESVRGHGELVLSHYLAVMEGDDEIARIRFGDIVSVSP